MIKVMLVGQKWLAAELFKLCRAKGLTITAVAVPSIDDRLALLAQAHQVAVRIAPKQLQANDVPQGTDLILCAHAHCYVTKEARQKAQLGALGYHPSLLPVYKGKDAIAQAIAHNETITGGSLYWLDDGWDTGQVFMQQQCSILPSDTAPTLWQRDLAPLALELFSRALDDLMPQTEAVPPDF